MNKHPYLKLNNIDSYKEFPPTYTVLKYKVGDRVRILVNYLSEIGEDITPVWEATITSTDMKDLELPYYIGEVRCYFNETELELI